MSRAHNDSGTFAMSGIADESRELKRFAPRVSPRWDRNGTDVFSSPDQVRNPRGLGNLPFPNPPVRPVAVPAIRAHLRCLAWRR